MNVFSTYHQGSYLTIFYFKETLHEVCMKLCMKEMTGVQFLKDTNLYHQIYEHRIQVQTSKI